MMNSIEKEDVEVFIEKNKALLGRLSESSILITGATGLIGSFTVFVLCEYNKRYNANIKIVAPVRSISKAKDKFWGYDNINFISADITEKIKYEGRIDYIIHCAAVTASGDFVKRPVETIMTTVKGTENVLETAFEKDIKGMVYLSSLEIYGNYEYDGVKDIKEDDYGTLSTTSIRSSYPESKRMAECLCVAMLKEYGAPVKIARLTQTFGAGVDYTDSRVFAEFARCAIEGRSIVLHTKGETVRNYCYLSDAAAAILYILLYGTEGEVYNVANSSTTVSIYDMAKLVSELSEKNISVIIKNDVNENMGYNPVMRVSLNSQKLETLGWKPEYDLRDMYIRTIESMKADGKQR